MNQAVPAQRPNVLSNWKPLSCDSVVGELEDNTGRKILGFCTRPIVLTRMIGTDIIAFTQSGKTFILKDGQNRDESIKFIARKMIRKKQQTPRKEETCDLSLL